MNWERLEGHWKRLAGRAQEQWGKLTNDDIAVIASHRDQLTGKVQERYGVARDEAERQVARWEHSAVEAWIPVNERT